MNTTEKARGKHRQTGMQIDRQTDRQTDRHMGSQRHSHESSNMCCMAHTRVIKSSASFRDTLPWNHAWLAKKKAEQRQNKKIESQPCPSMEEWCVSKKRLGHERQDDHMATRICPTYTKRSNLNNSIGPCWVYGELYSDHTRTQEHCSSREA